MLLAGQICGTRLLILPVKAASVQQLGQQIYDHIRLCHNRVFERGGLV
jgi:hypothetical protein